MALTFDDLVQLLTPDASGTLTLDGTALQTPAITTLFAGYFPSSTLSLTQAAMTSDGATNTVTVSGQLAANAFLSLSSAALVLGTFTLDPASGTVAVTLPITVGDAGWTLSQAFPGLAGSILDDIGYASPTFTLAAPQASPLPADFRTELGYPADLGPVASAMVKGLSFSCNLTLPTTRAPLSYLPKLGLSWLLPDGPACAGPIDVWFDGKGQPNPQMALTVTALGADVSIGGDTFQFTLALGSVLQETASGDGSTVTVTPNGLLVASATFTPPAAQGTAAAIAPFQITATLDAATPSQVQFNAGSLPTGTFLVDALDGLFQGTAVGALLSPSGSTVSIGQSPLQLQRASFTVDVSQSSVSFSAIDVSVGLAPGDTLSAFGVLTFSSVAIDVSATNSGSGFATTANASCAATLDGDAAATLTASIAYPDLTVTASLADTDTVSLTGFLDGLLGSGSIGMDSVTATTFSFTGDVSAGTYSVQGDVQEDWVLVSSGSDSLSLTDLSLDFSVSGGKPSGTLSAHFTVGNVAVPVTAGYAPAGGWTFSGSSQPGLALPLATLLQPIAGAFGGTLPSDVPTVTLDSVSVTYALPPGGGAGSLSIDASLGVDGATVNLANLPVVGSLAGSDAELGLTAIAIAAEAGGKTPTTASVTFTVLLGAAGTKSLVVPLFGGTASQAGGSDGGSDGGMAPAATADASPSPSTSSPSAAGGSDGTGSGSDASGGNGVWIDVERSFGPVSVKNVGFSVASGDLRAELNASLALGGLTIDVDGLSVSIPLSAPIDPTFAISGLSVDYTSPDLTISGALDESQSDGATTFAGDIIVTAGTLTLSAFASYMTSTPPAMYAFAVLDEPLGGPPAFFVTGLAAGLGVNTQLTMPDVGDVPTFPLIQAAAGDSAFGSPPSIDGFVTGMSAVCPSAPGETWIAAGVTFTTFKVVKSTALATVQFGNDFQVALLGESTLAVPLPGSQDNAVYAVMGLEALYTPAQGEFSFSAQLTSASYVLDPACHLTGGFAVCLWFDPSPYAGDFVVTLGGYNPHFTPPSYYPSVPALGIDWQVSDALSITGTEYMAMTPHLLMAGGAFSAVWQSGSLKAWFDLYADFLIQWMPFQYQIDAGVQFGVQATINLLFTSLTLKVTVGASLSIQGPPFSGTATIDLSVLSFTISFGATPTTPSVTWAEFESQFLPDGASSGSGVARLSVQSGLLKDLTGLKSASGTAYSGRCYVVDPRLLVLGALSAIPIVSASLNGAAVEGDWTTALSVAPLDTALTASSLALTLQLDGADYGAVAATPQTGSVPQALWGTPGTGGLDVNGTSLLPNALTGVTLTPNPGTGGTECPIAISVLCESLGAVYAAPFAADGAPTTDGFSQTNSDQQLADTVGDATVAATRAGILAGLAACGLPVTQTPDVAPLTDAAELGLLSPVVLSLLGETATAATASAAGSAGQS